MQFDILIRGGEVIDPSQDLRGVRDVAIRDGKIAAVAETLPDAEAPNVVIPMMSPSLPIQRSHPKVEPASTARR